MRADAASISGGYLSDARCSFGKGSARAQPARDLRLPSATACGVLGGLSLVVRLLPALESLVILRASAPRPHQLLQLAPAKSC